LSHLPKKEYIDELVEIYFNHTDVCHSTFSPVFYDSYKKLFATPPDQPINVPFLGVLFSAMANAVHVHPESDGPHAEKAGSTMQLYNDLSYQITDHPQYNLHIETVEAILLQSMFLLNEVFVVRKRILCSGENEQFVFEIETCYCGRANAWSPPRPELLQR
jgi:hypothetical protein